MYMKRYLGLLLMMVCSAVLYAQVPTTECLTEPKGTWVEQLKVRLQQSSQNSVAKPQLIGIQFQIHLFQKTDGTSAIALADLYAEIDSVNSFYANADIFFYECSAPNIVSDDSLYDYEYMTEEFDLLSQHYTTDVLNMYFPHTAFMQGVA